VTTAWKARSVSSRRRRRKWKKKKKGKAGDSFQRFPCNGGGSKPTMGLSVASYVTSFLSAGAFRADNGECYLPSFPSVSAAKAFLGVEAAAVLLSAKATNGKRRGC